MRTGKWAWISAVQFFATQVVVATAFTRPYSLARDYISDLGNTVCGATICSPWHAAMNVSFVAIGLTMAAGAILTRRAFAGWAGALAMVLFVTAGIGVMMVGLYPENEQNDLHVLGAGVNFATGNLALILFGIAAKGFSRSFTVFSVVLGVVGLIAAGVLAAEQWGALGVGTVERLAAYPQPIWQIVAGTLLPAAVSSSRSQS